MDKACQTICYVFTYLVLIFLGHPFGTAFWKLGIYAKHQWGGMPLPVITEFLIEHHRVASSFVLFPWLCFVGSPLLSASATRNYWRPTGFFLRFAAFLAVEAFIFSLFIFAVTSVYPSNPFVSFIGPMDTRADSLVERSFYFTDSAMAASIVLAVIFRLLQRRRTRPA